MLVRPHAVAGVFYPGDPQTLRRQVLAMLGAAQPTAAGAGQADAAQTWPKALIVPHAGYVYSGATAAQAFARLAPGRGRIRRVLLLGPVHRVPVRGLALPEAEAFDTPLGQVPLDRAAMESITSLPQVVRSAGAHAQEHSLEVQLPFLQAVLQDFALLPLAVGDATPAEVAQVLDALWGGPETLIVVSSDLSHYLPYDTARQVDAQTVAGILQGQPTLNHRQACGATPVNGLTLAARRHGLQPRLLAQCNSGDSVGDRSRVVGYAALVFEAVAQASDADLPADAGATLLPLARAAIAQALGRPDRAPEEAAWLRRPAACFITLMDHGKLRGCIGSLQAHRPLLEDVKANAVAAALRDHRFKPLALAELDGIEIELSLLSAPQPMSFLDEADALAQLRPGIDGLVLSHGTRRSTFLPQVWAQLPRPVDFMAQLKRKAGLAADFWAPDLRLQRYTVRKWTEAGLRGPGAPGVLH
jgi:AmmeMemoRadiSam system protein B/AmmeMemoRadiSam system protein A